MPRTSASGPVMVRLFEHQFGMVLLSFHRFSGGWFCWIRSQDEPNGIEVRFVQDALWQLGRAAPKEVWRRRCAPDQTFLGGLLGQELRGEVQQLVLVRQANPNVNLRQQTQLQRGLALLTPGRPLVREVRRAFAVILTRWNNRPGHAAGLNEGAIPLLEQHAHQGEGPVKTPAPMLFLIRVPLAVSGAGGLVYFELLLQAGGSICTGRHGLLPQHQRLHSLKNSQPAQWKPGDGTKSSQSHFIFSLEIAEPSLSFFIF